MVSVRPLGCSTDVSRFRSGMRAERYLGSGNHSSKGWIDIPLEEAIAAIQPPTPTVVFVHGNRVEPNEVRPRSIWVYRQLVSRCADERPIRFLIFSWPSDEIDGMIRDARLKAAKTKPAGFQLAWLLDQSPCEAPLGGLGYSFGARVLSGATHLLAGGSLGRLKLPDSCPCLNRPFRSVYIAPAFDSDWLGRGHYHGRSLERLDDLLITTNKRDPAMRFYPVLTASHPLAMGFKGPTCLASSDAPKVRLVNVSKAVGRTHDMCEYMSVRGLMSNAWRRLSFADRPLAQPTPQIAQAEPAAAR